MKRMISIVLAAAMLLSLMSVSAFAQTSVDSVHINFTVPSVGDTMITDRDTITTNSDAIMCNISAVFTGDVIDEIEEIDTLNELKPYINNFTFPTGTYTDQRYLIVIMLFSGSVELSTETTPTFEEGVTGGMLADGDLTYADSVYAYLLFEPTADESEGDNAGDTTSDTTLGEFAHDVRAIYDDSITTEKVYSFDVTWGALEFTYTPATEGAWNTTTHEYENPTSESWSLEGNMITIENHSNDEISAMFTYAADTGFDDISGEFFDTNGVSYTEKPVTIESAVGSSAETPPSESIFLILDGPLASTTLDMTRIGTVTITIQ